MSGWELLDSARVPGEGGEVRLFKRGREFSLRIDETELMNSLLHASEDALADIACGGLADNPSPAVLVGGLGMGYTLASALKRLGPGAKVTVVELLAVVVAWNRGPLGHLAGHPLDDGRVTLREGDVAKALRRECAAYDAVLLDVDNGPQGLVRGANDWIYSEDGLAAAFKALMPGGFLAVWSAGPDPAFRMRLCKTGFETAEHRVRTRAGRRDWHHTVWTGRKHE